MEGKSNPSFVEDGCEKLNGSLSSPQNDGKMDAEMQRIPNVVPESDNGDDNYVDEDVKKGKDGIFDKYFKDLSEICKKHYKKAVIVTLYLLVLAYGIAATVIWSQEKDEVDWCNGIGLLWLMLGAILLDLLLSIGRHFHAFDWMTPVIEKPAEAMWTRIWRLKVFRVAIYFAPLVAVIIYLAVDAGGDTLRWTSFLGLVVLMLLGFIFSRHRGKINWRTVTWGLALQYGFGLLTIRWDVGRSILQCIGDKVTVFLNYTNSGSIMVYGNDLIINKAVFAFQVLSTIFFFSFCIQILYYYGVMQWIIIKLGIILQKTMGTTACESINTAASVFVGMGELAPSFIPAVRISAFGLYPGSNKNFGKPKETESPLLIKPYIRILTKSEMHAIMAGGLATIAGSVMAAYISFGVSPAHLITASIMSAPAALCYSKLFYPETEKTKTGASDITMGRGEESNVLDAAAAGAHAAIELVLGIIANLIAFISFVAFLNGVISWFGGLLGAPQLSFEWILSKVFIPLAWLLGVAPEECDKVATLMGLKTIVNEFVAYKQLADYIKAGQISKRAEVIATYALCGFSNPGSVGILIGVLSAMAPERRSVITEVALRSFIAGSATCFLTACVAGTLLDDSILSGFSHTSNFTTTASP